MQPASSRADEKPQLLACDPEGELDTSTATKPEGQFGSKTHQRRFELRRGKRRVNKKLHSKSASPSKHLLFLMHREAILALYRISNHDSSVPCFPRSYLCSTTEDNEKRKEFHTKEHQREAQRGEKSTQSKSEGCSRVPLKKLDVWIALFTKKRARMLAVQRQLFSAASIFSGQIRFDPL